MNCFSLQLYEKGLALVQQSDRSKMAGEFLSAITRLSLRLEDYPRACAAIRDEIEKYLEVSIWDNTGRMITIQMNISRLLSHRCARHFVSVSWPLQWFSSNWPWRIPSLRAVNISKSFSEFIFN